MSFMSGKPEGSISKTIEYRSLTPAKRKHANFITTIKQSISEQTPTCYQHNVIFVIRGGGLPYKRTGVLVVTFRGKKAFLLLGRSASKRSGEREGAFSVLKI